MNEQKTIEKSRTEYSVLNILTGVGGYFLNTVMGLVCRMVFTRCLSADYLGANGLLTNVISMLSLAELGIGNAIVFALYKPIAEHDTDKIASLVKLYGKAYRIVGFVVAGVGLALMPFLNVIIRTKPNISESIYLLYLINLFNTASTYFFSYKSSLIIASQKNYIVSIVNYIVTISQSIIQIVLLISMHNYLAYLLVQTAGIFVNNIVISLIADKEFPYIKAKNIKPLEKGETKKLFHNVRDLSIYKISELLVNSTDNILITFFKGLALTGLTSNYTLLVNTLTSLLKEIFNGITASVGNVNATESDSKKHSTFEFLHMMNFWLFGWCAVGILFCSSDLVSLLFGKNYVMKISIPFVMALNFYTVGMQTAVWTFKQTMGIFHHGRFIQLFTGILNIIFSILLGIKFGIFGILFATFLSRLCTSLWYDPYAIYRYGFHRHVSEYFKKYFYYLFVLLVTDICCYFACKCISMNIFIQVILKIIICSIICNVVFWAFLHKLPEYDKMKNIAANVKQLVIRKILR